MLVTVLVGYFGFSQGTLPYLPSKSAIDLAIVVHVVGYLSFSMAYQCLVRATVRRDPCPAYRAAACAYLIVPFAALGAAGVLADARRRRGVHRVCLVADRASPAGRGGDDAPGAAGNFLKHFLGFAVVLAWSWWLGRPPRRKVPIIARDGRGRGRAPDRQLPLQPWHDARTDPRPGCRVLGRTCGGFRSRA